MARNKFGGTNMDVVWAPVGRLAAFAPPHTLTMYDAEEGGNRLDDLLDKDGNPVTSIRSRADGGVPLFWGPDGVTELWVDDGDDKRALMVTQGRKGDKGEPGAKGEPGQDGAPGSGGWAIDSNDPDVLIVTPDDQTYIDPTDSDVLVVVA